MAKKISTKTSGKTTRVREHPRHVSVSKKNPAGITVVDEHLRRAPGTYLNADEIGRIAKGYDRKNLVYPAAGKLNEYVGADTYDESIAIWVDYFNQKFAADGKSAQKTPVTKLDPDVVKALIASESGFEKAPDNPKAIGIAQITPETFEALQDPEGETKEFIFSGVRQKDLKDPEIAIPMAVRWLHRKKTARRRKT